MRRPWQVILSRRIDPRLGTPLYRQIARALIHEIESGRLERGEYLPSSREMAAALGVNRKTVVSTYEDLIAQGWLETSGTRGTMVATSLDGLTARPQRDDSRGRSPGKPAYRFHAPPAHPLAQPTGSWLRLDEGSPDGRLFPIDVFVRAQRDAILRARKENRLLYRDPLGSPLLREAIANMLSAQRGLPVSAENVCITRGSQNGIYLAARALLSAGDVVLVEELTYEPALASFEAHGARAIAVPLDAQGIDVEAVERACRRHRVRAIFLTPHHQFPTTVSLRPERRLRLLELSRQFGFALIEDDYDHEYHFESQPLLPMASYAPERVIYIGSLSKLLMPALRIGYLVAPSAFLESVAHGVSMIDGMGNTLTEDAVALLIEAGELRRHARKATQVYAARRDAFADSLDRRLGDVARWEKPDGGLAFWLTFPDAATLDRIEARAPAEGVRFAASRSFAAREGATRGLRLGFGSLDPAEAARALDLMARTLD